MRDAFKLDLFVDAPGSSGPRTIRASTLIAIRWVAIAGQFLTVLIVHVGIGYETPLALCLLAIAASIALNFWLRARYGGARQMSWRSALASLGFDAAQLAFLLGLTGGLHNPFAILILAPVTVSASILPGPKTLWLGGFVAALVTLISVAHLPLPGPFPTMPLEYALASWAATLVGVVFVSAYVARVATEQRRMQQALSVVEATLRREQQVSAVGALAAAAAHELGTPLATISLVAKELSREMDPESEAGEDAALLVSQAERCRAILAHLTASPSGDTGDRFYPISASALIEDIAAPRRSPDIGLTVVKRPVSPDAGPEPRVKRTPELVNGLANILSNALQFANEEVTATVTWSPRHIAIAVVDDGRGFPAETLQRIGEPYISTRRNEDGHMGLGLFIARTLLENTGARLTFANRPGAGAEVTASWSRADVEAIVEEERDEQ